VFDFIADISSSDTLAPILQDKKARKLTKKRVRMPVFYPRWDAPV
jgi:hypothetical protein